MITDAAFFHWIIALISVFFSAAAFALYYRSRQRNMYRALFLKEKELREYHEEFKTILYSIGDGVITTDLQGRIRQMNHTAAALTGWSEHQADGMPMDEVFRIINEHTRLTIESPITKVLHEGCTVGLANHTLLVSKDGREIPIADSGAPIRNELGETLGTVLVFRDKTEEHGAEKKLRESEEKYRLLFERMMNGFALHEIICNEAGTPVDYRFLEVNHAFSSMTGLTAETVIGRTCLEVLPETEPSWIERYGRIALTGGSIRFDQFSGALNKYFEVTAYSPTKGRFATIFEDITARKMTEAALLESEQNYRTLANSGMALIWTSGTDTLCTYFNSVWLEFTGRTLEQEFGNGWAEGVHPDDLQHCINIYLGAFGRREKFSMEYRLRRHDGEYRWLLDEGVPRYNHRGEFIGYIGHCLDITERKHAEEAMRSNELRLKAALKIAQVANWEFSIAGDRLWASEDAFRMFGLAPDAGHNIRLAEVEARMSDRESVHQALIDLVTLDKPFDLEITINPADGGPARTIHSIAHCIRDTEGKPQQVVGVVQDITDRKNTEQILRDIQRRESIGILSGGIAHDFNNLLGTMMGNISLAQNHLPEGHPASQNIEKALTAMERAAHLTGQMLAYSGKGKFQNRLVDLAKLIEDHVGLFQVSMPKNVKLETHFISSPVYVNGDPAQLEQIIMNLIINGGDAIGEKQGTVSIRVSKRFLSRDELQQYRVLSNDTMAEGEYALFEVADTGCGMNKETLLKIFDPFFTTKFAGRGLGLSAVLGIVQGHKGGIAVESVEGEGTTFRLVLPSFASPPPSDEPAAVAGAVESAAGKTILIIDDEYDVATTAQEMLETAEYTTVVELSPMHGIARFKELQPSIGIVLLDLTMPEMSGKEVVVALREIDPDVKIIISSGYSEDEVTKKIGGAKVAAFIQKPYRLKSLLDVVQDVMRR